MHRSGPRLPHATGLLPALGLTSLAPAPANPRSRPLAQRPLLRTHRSLCGVVRTRRTGRRLVFCERVFLSPGLGRSLAPALPPRSLLPSSPGLDPAARIRAAVPCPGPHVRGKHFPLRFLVGLCSGGGGWAASGPPPLRIPRRGLCQEDLQPTERSSHLTPGRPLTGLPRDGLGSGSELRGRCSLARECPPWAAPAAQPVSLLQVECCGVRSQDGHGDGKPQCGVRAPARGCPCLESFLVGAGLGFGVQGSAPALGTARSRPWLSCTPRGRCDIPVALSLKSRSTLVKSEPGALSGCPVYCSRPSERGLGLCLVLDAVR